MSDNLLFLFFPDYLHPWPPCSSSSIASLATTTAMSLPCCWSNTGLKRRRLKPRFETTVIDWFETTAATVSRRRGDENKRGKERSCYWEMNERRWLRWTETQSTDVGSDEREWKSFWHKLKREKTYKKEEEEGLWVLIFFIKNK